MDGTVSLQSADYTKFGRLVGKGWRRSGGLAWNGLLPFWGIHGEFGTTWIIKPAFSKLWLVSTGSSPVCILLYRYFHSI